MTWSRGTLKPLFHCLISTPGHQSLAQSNIFSSRRLFGQQSLSWPLADRVYVKMLSPSFQRIQILRLGPKAVYYIPEVLQITSSSQVPPTGWYESSWTPIYAYSHGIGQQWLVNSLTVYLDRNTSENEE